jgi:hypothetical protein
LICRSNENNNQILPVVRFGDAIRFRASGIRRSVFFSQPCQRGELEYCIKLELRRHCARTDND